MRIFQGKKILIFAPQFFNYEIEIANKLREFGAEVYLYDERPSNSFITKLLIRINPLLLANAIRKHFLDIVNAHKVSEFDYILFFKGETLSIELLKELKATFEHAKIILYMMDSIKNYPHIESCLDYFDKALSFDLNDTKKIHTLEFRPLFYLDDYKKISSLKETFINVDILFIGTVHSDRWKFLNKIAVLAKAIDLSVNYYLYFQSPVIFWFRKLCNKSYWSIPIHYAKFTSLSKKSVIEMMEHSSVIIDIQHPKQSGLTMRTIEVFGAGRKLITTNEQIKYYDLYNETNILVIDRQNPILDYNFMRSDYVKPDALLYKKYSIGQWLIDVFS